MSTLTLSLLFMLAAVALGILAVLAYVLGGVVRTLRNVDGALPELISILRNPQVPDRPKFGPWSPVPDIRKYVPAGLDLEFDASKCALCGGLGGSNPACPSCGLIAAPSPVPEATRAPLRFTILEPTTVEAGTAERRCLDCGGSVYVRQSGTERDLVCPKCGASCPIDQGRYVQQRAASVSSPPSFS